MGTQFSPPGRSGPYLAVHSIHPPFTASLFAIPRAVCARYKTDRRCSSHGLGFLAPAGMGPPTWESGLSPPLNPQAERRVSPSVVCVQQEAATCTQSGGLLFRVGRPRCFHLALWGRVLFTPGMPRGQWHAGDGRNQTRRRKSISHAMLPSRLSPHAAAGFTGVQFKESQQRQLFGPPGYGSHCVATPKPAPSRCSRWHLPGPTSSASCRTVLCPESPPFPPAVPGGASLSSGLGLGRRLGRATPARVPRVWQSCRGRPT